MNAATDIKVETLSADLARWVAEFIEALRLLPQEIAQSFLCRLQDILREPIVHLSKAGDGAASGTCHGCITIEFVGMNELLSAARGAA